MHPADPGLVGKSAIRTVCVCVCMLSVRKPARWEQQ